MKFRQNIILFLAILVVDLILCGVTLRMWKGEDGEKDFKGDVYHERNKEGNESGVQEKRNGRERSCSGKIGHGTGEGDRYEKIRGAHIR